MCVCVCVCVCLCACVCVCLCLCLCLALRMQNCTHDKKSDIHLVDLHLVREMTHVPNVVPGVILIYIYIYIYYIDMYYVI